MAELLRQADAVLVGVGSGMSSAAGYNHYHYNEMFQKHFEDFEQTYGIRNLFQGFYYVYSKPEQQWGFYSKYIEFMEEVPVGQPYRDLYECLEGSISRNVKRKGRHRKGSVLTCKENRLRD